MNAVGGRDRNAQRKKADAMTDFFSEAARNHDLAGEGADIRVQDGGAMTLTREYMT